MTRLPTVGVLDYGSGNVHSACRALEAAGSKVILTANAARLAQADGLVVPGVGAFAACMDALNAVGGDDIVRAALAGQKPVLGICVGHQIMFEAGREHGVDTDGLGVLPGIVERLPATRLPHMGWNTLAEARLGALTGVQGERFYFVHSYARLADLGMPARSSFARAAHEGVEFVAAVEFESLTSTQFHPEKSGAAGARLLRNWVSTFR